jgi:glycosyltransferase involved in cell wall biosynthesis
MDLESQNYKTFEVIIVDQSDDFNVDFYQSFNLEIQLIHQKEKALWLARNTAVRKSKGDYILLFDDDSRVDEDWILHHLKCLDFFNASVSSGISLSEVGDKIPENYSFFRVSDQLDTGNVLLNKSCFHNTGLFDRQFEKQRMGDGEFGMRLYMEGYLNISNPYAKRIHLKVSSGGLREMGSWDAFRPKKLLAPRPVPSVLYFIRRYFGTSSALFTIFKTIPFSLVPYKYKSSNKFKAIGLLIFILFLPLWIFVVLRSWLVSSRMLKLGPKINTL